MSKLRFPLLAAAASFAMLSAAAATGAITLHVTTGEWQITNASKMSGMENMMGGMNEAQMAQMPPATRARIQAMMASMNGVHTNTVKSCVTQKDLDRPFNPDMGHEKDESCKYDVQKASFTDEVVHVSCTGARLMDGTFQVSATSLTSMRGHLDMTVTERGHSMHMVDDISGHWVAANCSASDNSVQ